MTDQSHSSDGGRSSHGGQVPRPIPTPEQVATTYRQLADAYSLQRAGSNHERTWQRIDLKGSFKRRGLVSPRTRTRLRWAGWSLAVAAAAAMVLFVATPGDGRLEYALEGGHVEQGWVVTAKQLARLEFSDGSELRLAEDSALSVDTLGPHSALTRLARGTVHVQVKHHDDTRWTFLAGPYEVRVEGTAFDLSWRAEALEVNMHEGRVRVVGPDRREWVLQKGDDLVVPPAVVQPLQPAALQPADGQPVALQPADGQPSAARGLDGSVMADPLGGGTDSLTKGEETLDGVVTDGVAARKSADWSKLLKQGRFADVVREGKQGGIEHALRSRSIGDVEALGQSARYTGDSTLAEECWKSIRSRAPGSGAARQSAFFLGRVMEQQGRRSEAIQWFARYREEAGSGVYAGQALGRQMVLTSGQGRSAAARELAQVYLERFPSGPYAKAARGLAGGGTAESPLKE